MCGYEPIYSSKEQNFYIDTISTEIDDKISRNIEKKLKPYTEKNDKEKISLKINSNKKKKSYQKIIKEIQLF